MSSNSLPILSLPSDYDYVACYLTDFCFLKCSYCLTDHNGAEFTGGTTNKCELLDADAWLRIISRIAYPSDVVATLQGGEPFLHRGIWEIIANSPVPLDILTALPLSVKPKKFVKAGNLDKLSRSAPYPNVRVSYHKGQNNIEDLARRVYELQDLISIGIYFVDHPAFPEEADRAREICERQGVFFKTKEFLGYHDGKLYGEYFYPDACVGKVTRESVLCRNTVLIISPSGDVFRCHSDLYNKRYELKVGNLTDPDFKLTATHSPCSFYGTCSECDVKVKTNHYQQFGYTSVEITDLEGEAISSTTQNK